MDAQVNKYERAIRDMLGTGDGQCRYSEHVGKMVWVPLVRSMNASDSVSWGQGSPVSEGPGLSSRLRVREM